MAKGIANTQPARSAMITWLENKANFALITGAATHGQRLTSGQKLKKLDGYRALAQYVNRKVPCTEWDEKAGKSRYESYLATYKKTRAKSNTVDFRVCGWISVMVFGRGCRPVACSRRVA
ncbi:hypothetical protein PsorP6_009496 [Peronosclerospora sorghi]|uniref:Uncharacterized protein n=1 Tax=Peronosclerospora sorghi TaxID=230839 RepID=A0ACC0W0W2_9STRA|nr:hypothetical protein PsorP6_009496 [Peronosclerospora sorghi]